jgi:tRNA pseudouridine38-40 synthase
MVQGPGQRIAFTVHYDGSAFFGWQLQRSEPSVQGQIEQVLTRLFDRPARVLGSGRTDRGVHASGQVATVDAPASWQAAELRRAMNALLPESIWIANAAVVGDSFHPRYDAIARSYLYRVGTAETTASPFIGRWCWPLQRPLELDLMAVASAVLPGDHSFRAFAKSGQEERGDRCIVTEAGWEDWSGVGLEFRITANRFLHHMVRYLVGTLIDVGLGRRRPGDVALLLSGKGDLESSPPAPAKGLFLASVQYPAGAFDTALATDPSAGPIPPIPLESDD